MLKVDDDHNETVLKEVYNRLKATIETEDLKKQNEALRDQLAKTSDSILQQKTTYSGQLVLKRNVDLYEPRDRKSRNKEPKKSSTEFVVDKATVRFYNNRADKIAITGHLSTDTNKEDTKVLINTVWSLPLRELNNRKQLNAIETKGGKTFIYRYDDVFHYKPTKRLNYAVSNQEIAIFPNDSVKIKERKIGDYFTGVFFSDILGLNSKNSNSLTIAEGRVRVPFNLRNFGKWTFFDNISAYASVVLVGGLDENSRNLDLGSKGSTEELRFSLDNFDLLRANNADLGIHLTPLSFEWKGASTFIHARYGLRLLRTGANYEFETPTFDSDGNPAEAIVENRSLQIYSVGQEAELNFEVRPQSSIGLDLTVGLSWFGSTGSNSDIVDIATTNNSYNLKVMANLFSMVNPEKSRAGLFVRVGGHYNKGLSEVFPQLMVGYATNLTSFVNKFSDKD